MGSYDEFLDQELAGVLRPGEQEQMRLAAVSPFYLVPIFGSLATCYYCVLTDQRVILIRTKKGFGFRWQGLRLKRVNKGVITFDHDKLTKVVTVRLGIAARLMGARGVRLESAERKPLTFIARRSNMFASGGEFSDLAHAIAGHAGEDKLEVSRKKR